MCVECIGLLPPFAADDLPLTLCRIIMTNSPYRPETVDGFPVPPPRIAMRPGESRWDPGHGHALDQLAHRPMHHAVRMLERVRAVRPCTRDAITPALFLLAVPPRQLGLGGLGEHPRLFRSEEDTRLFAGVDAGQTGVCASDRRREPSGVDPRVRGFFCGLRRPSQCGMSHHFRSGPALAVLADYPDALPRRDPACLPRTP